MGAVGQYVNRRVNRRVNRWLAGVVAVVCGCGAARALANTAPDAQVAAVAAQLGAPAITQSSLSPELEALVASISEDGHVEKSLRFYAASKLDAVQTNPRDAQAVKMALERVFVAKGCVSREVDDFAYQQALLAKIDNAILTSPPLRDAWRRVQEADRGNVRANRTDSAKTCPLPANPDDHASHVVEVPDVASDGTPIRIKVRYARPTSVAGSENDATLMGTDHNGNGLRDDVEAYIAALPQNATTLQTLRFLAVQETAVMLANVDRPHDLTRAWRAQQSAWACVYRDIRSQKVRNKLARRISAHITNTEQRAAAMYRAKVAISRIEPDPEATQKILCPLPEVALR